MDTYFKAVAEKNAIHYNTITSNYNYYFKPTHDASVQIIIDRLQLQQDDRLLDLGAATGLLASLIRNIVALKNPITCVEPCESFWEYLYKLDGIVVEPKNADEFYDELSKKVLDGEKKVPNKVLIVEALHHFSDPKGCLDKIIDFLPHGGMLINLERPNICCPLPFARVHLQQKHAQQMVTDMIIPHLKQRNDVVVETFHEFFSYDIKRERWYNMIRGRFVSSLEMDTDEELEKSIEELEKERFGGLKDDDNITIKDQSMITKVTKAM